MSRVLKSTSPEDESGVRLYEIKEEFEQYSYQEFSTPPISGTQEAPEKVRGKHRISGRATPQSSTSDSPASRASILDSVSDAELSVAPVGIPSPNEALLGTAIQECIRVQQRMRKEMGDHVRELAVAIARKIICRVGDQRPDLVRDQVRIALDKVGPDVPLTIRVHPRDAEYLVARKTTILHSPDDSDRVAITGDPSMIPGGCVIETDRELIDASIESQLELVELAMRDLGPGVNSP